MSDTKRFRVCGCPADRPCDETKHQRNAELALTAQCWALHESAVVNSDQEASA